MPVGIQILLMRGGAIQTIEQRKQLGNRLQDVSVGVNRSYGYVRALALS